MSSSKTSKQTKKTAQSTKSVQMPTSSARVITNAAPQYVHMRPDSIRVRNREFLSDIAGSPGFTFDEFNVNPGLAETSPWLSEIANRYERYKYHSLRFIYEPACGTTVPGTVMLALDYDPTDAVPDSKTTVMAWKHSVRTSPFFGCAHVTDPRDVRGMANEGLFVRGGLPPANSDLKTYDVGRIFVCTQGQADTSDIGELYVEYDVELFIPQMTQFAPTLSVENATGSGVATNAVFGTALTPLNAGTSNNIDYTLVDASTVRLNQAGTFLVTLLVNAATSWTLGALTTGPGFVQVLSTLGLSPTTAAVNSLQFVIKAARGDLFRPVGTLVGTPGATRLRIVGAAPAA